VLPFKLLRCFDGAASFPLAKPDFPIEGNTAGDDVDVVVVGVAVTHGDIGRGIVKAHVTHEVGRDNIPLFAVQSLAFRQGEAAMPDRPGDVRPKPTHGGELRSEIAGIGARHIPADDLRLFLAFVARADIKNIVERTAKTATAANLRFHLLRPLQRD
jgi:hypothetical protein